MSRRIVTLTDAFGDTITGVEHETQSDLPNTIDANGTHWFETTWARNGWTITNRGEWE